MERARAKLTLDRMNTMREALLMNVYQFTHIELSQETGQYRNIHKIQRCKRAKKDDPKITVQRRLGY